jgi:hypothetical protein
VARQSSAKASTSVRIRSGPLKIRPVRFTIPHRSLNLVEMKYYKQIGIATCLLLIIACFLPWTFHADVNETFTGFFSEKDMYGKPGKVLIFFAVASLILIWLDKVWAKRTHMFMSAVLVGYAIKTYILYVSCYNAYCPDKKIGVYLMLICSIIILVLSIFPKLNLSEPKQ